MTGPPVRCRVEISGRVQGVWFREGAAREAGRLGVAGWVRNRPDGRVEAAFEGSPDAVEALVAWCQLGPPRARVTGLHRREELPTGARGFEIR